MLYLKQANKQTLELFICLKSIPPSPSTRCCCFFRLLFRLVVAHQIIYTWIPSAVVDPRPTHHPPPPPSANRSISVLRPHSRLTLHSGFKRAGQPNAFFNNIIYRSFSVSLCCEDCCANAEIPPSFGVVNRDKTVGTPFQDTEHNTLLHTNTDRTNVRCFRQFVCVMCLATIKFNQATPSHM